MRKDKEDMPDLTPSEMDVLHVLANWGPLDVEQIEQIVFAGAVLKTAREIFDLVTEGYMDIDLVDGDIVVQGIDHLVPFSHVVATIFNDKDIPIFYDLEGEEDAQN